MVAPKAKHTCQCKDSGLSGGTMSLTTIEKPGAAEHVSDDTHTHFQSRYMPHLAEVETSHHVGAEHAHPYDMKATSALNLAEKLHDHNLTLRVSYTPHDYHKTAVCSEVGKDALDALLRDGAVAIDAPLNRGEFRLHSARTGQITGMEFIPS